MVRVIWAKLSGLTNVDELLELILDLSVAMHGLVSLTARSGCICTGRGAWSAWPGRGSVGAVHGPVVVQSRSWLGWDACGTWLGRDAPSWHGRGARLCRDAPTCTAQSGRACAHSRGSHGSVAVPSHVSIFLVS